jgi:hypothetical protein
MAGAAEWSAATVSIDQDTYWRLVTKGVTRDVAASRARLQGQSDLALRVLESVAIIA